MHALLSIKNIEAKIGAKKIINGVSFDIKPGEIHVIMGPNGAGKSTLINAIMGNPAIEITKGSVTCDDEIVTKKKPEERAAAGLFMAFQYPREIPGLQLDNFLYTAYQTLRKNRGEKEIASVFEFNKRLQTEVEKLHMKPELASRNLNEGFSGGEKKKAEMLQLALLEPEIALLDETDSGLDVDALKIVAGAITRYMNKDRAALIVTHYNRLLEFVTPDVIHVMVGGKIVKSGGPELAREIEKRGFEKYA